MDYLVVNVTPAQSICSIKLKHSISSPDFRATLHSDILNKLHSTLGSHYLQNPLFKSVHLIIPASVAVLD